MSALCVSAVEHVLSMGGITKEYDECFREELGVSKELEVNLQLKQDAKQTFLKSSKVPYALQDWVEKQLEDLIKRDVIEGVHHPKWATPAVNISKRESEVWICGYCKPTEKPQLEFDQYALLTTNDLFKTLNEGQKFTKLNLRRAYWQLVLNEKSRKYVTIHTHKGLYRYKRLPYEIASAPAIFQKLIEILLGGILGVCVFLDCVLVTATDDATLLKRLHEV